MLTVGDTLPYETHARILHLTQETRERLKLGLAINAIAHYGQLPKSERCFQRSAEGIAPQPNPPNNLQRNIFQQNQPRQQDNRRQRQ